MVSGEHFHVVWRVFPHLDLIQMSGLLSGLVLLARRGVVSLSVQFMDQVVDAPYAAMELLITESRSGTTRKVIWEFYDRTDRILPAVQFADAYFKRQCGPRSREACPDKIRPLGLTVPGYTWGALRLVAPAIFATIKNQEARRRSKSFRALLKDGLSQALLWLTLPRPDSAARKASDVKQPGIVFQPRLWGGGDGPNPVYEEANADRIHLVRALKAAFPGEAGIGLVHGPAARRLAPELLLNRPVSMEAHRRQLRNRTIAVNCAGLSGSVGWKFPEYLAAGNAIVSPPITMEYPSPIEAGLHYLPYATPAECVEQCRRLLADPALAQRMGEVNCDYYQRWIHPPAHALSLLQRAFQ